MIELIFDSDGLIKLTKSEVIESILSTFTCFISEEVRRESVDEGKRRFYEDAFQIEEFIKQRKLTVKKKIKPVNKVTLKKPINLGEGEKSTLQLFFDIKAKAIISDDQAFISLLCENNIPFIIPTDLIVRLVKLGNLEKVKGLRCLEKIKPYVRESNYLSAKNRLEVI